jgi:hypothetical protein
MYLIILINVILRMIGPGAETGGPADIEGVVTGMVYGERIGV